MKQKHLGSQLLQAYILFMLLDLISHSIIHNLDINHFLEDFKKWGPNARTLIRLSCGLSPNSQLLREVTSAASRFVRDPATITMAASSQQFFYALFTITPIHDDDRSDYTSKVTNRYICGLVMEEIASLDMAAQVSFYRRASTLPQFEGTWGYMFESYFLVWLCSAERADELSCIAKSTMSAKPSRSSKELCLKPLERKKVIVVNEVSYFKEARARDTPFGWLPVSQILPSLDAVICTDNNIITIQLAISSAEHTMIDDGFKLLEHNLPSRFKRTRTWVHVFVTDREETAISLRNQSHEVATQRNILIYSMVLDIPACKFSPADVKHTFTPSVRWCK
jgi:hypothetical protein